MSPTAVQKVISACKVILGEDGSNRGARKVAQICENSNFFRSELQKMGFEVLSDNDSPVMPIMLYDPAKIPAFSQECLRNNVISKIGNLIGIKYFPVEPQKPHAVNNVMKLN